MISDPTFSKTVPLKSVGSAIQVAENWFVEIKEGATEAHPRIEHAKGGGLELRWDAPVARARVWQPLDLERAGQLTNLDLAASVHLTGATGDVVDWIAILEEHDGNPRFHAKFKPDVSKSDAAGTISAVARSVTLDPGKRYRFSIQFVAAPNRVVLHSVELVCAQPETDLDSARTSDSAVQQAVRSLWEQKDQQALLRLMDEVGGMTVPVVSPNPLRSQVIRYFARAMLSMNVSETAYAHYKWLLDTPILTEPFSDAELTEIRKSFARSCVRTGRISEAIATYDDLLRDDPLDWEPYFHLGVLQHSDNVRTRRLFHDSAASLAEPIPASALTTIAEAYIGEGAADEALNRALKRLGGASVGKQQAPGDDAELILTAGNAWLALGETELWLAHLQRYFGTFGLQGPDIRPTDASRHILQVPEIASPSPRSGPLVTVIMTCFNSAETVEYAARSVLRQTHANLRLVIVDDASEDHSRDLIKKLAAEDDRVVPMLNETNVGTYCSKNKALRKFESDFYAFHDSDDWMHPDRISIHLAAMKNAIRFTNSMWIRLDDTGRAVVRSAGGYLQDNPASTFFGADVLDTIGFFDSVRAGADSEFTWRARQMLGTAAIHHIRMPLAVGLSRTGSLTRSGPAAFDEHRYSSVRLSYWESWAQWHNRAVLHSTTEDLFLPYPLDRRRFDAPAEILSTKIRR